jgi:uncharacterized protein YjbJ (UPF0337 family)
MEMTRDRMVGGFQRLAGALEQGWGWLISDETLRIRGELDRRLGRARQEYDPADETVINHARNERG